MLNGTMTTHGPHCSLPRQPTKIDFISRIERYEKPTKHMNYVGLPRTKDQDPYNDQLNLDVSQQHKQLFKEFNQKTSPLENLYQRLEEDKWVLKFDDENNNQTFLHMVAKMSKKNIDPMGMEEWWSSALYKMIPWIFENGSDLLVHGNPPILRHSSKKCVHVAHCILNLLLDQDSRSRLHEGCEGSCRAEVKHPLIDYVMETSADQTKCFHMHRDRIMSLHEKLEKNVRDTVKPDDGGKSCLHEIIEHYRESPDVKAITKLISIVDPKIVKKEKLLHLAVKQFERPDKSDKDALIDLQKIVQTIIEVCPEGPYEKDTQQKTAYAKLLQYSRNQKAEDNSEMAIDVRYGVIEVLKNAHIGDPTRSHQAKIDCLYPRGTEARRICLDLGSDNQIGQNYVKAITDQQFDNFIFETSLSYVSLPPRKDAKAINESKGNKDDILETYEDIFKFLAKQKVKKIFTIVVDDLTGTPHSDEAIVGLLSGFEIDHWNWKKLDFSSNTILKAAPNVRSVVLHSSGNRAALEGWCCKHGIAMLRHLDKVEIIIHQGVETLTSLKECQEYCKQKLEQRFAKNGRKGVEVSIKLYTYQANSSRIGRTGRTRRAKKNHDWIVHMDEFTKAIANYDCPRNIRVVKVALIDDGIDPERIAGYFQVHQGKTFDFEGNIGDHYFADPGKHGTIMGRLITNICPGLELYVARIEKSAQSDIPVEAATQAIRWALKEEVDIISMSWTIPSKGPNPELIKEFSKAITEATGQNKLLFCALPESEEALIELDFLPVSSETVFKIGSATRSGNLVKHSSGDVKTAQFILPGLDVLLDHEESDQTLNGSSIATALAAGLAALILFCADIVDQNPDSGTGRSDYGQKLRNFSTMQEVFHLMSRGSNENNFPEVKKFFSVDGEDVTTASLKRLIHSLTAGIL